MRYDFIKTVSEKGELIHKRTTKPLFEKIGAESERIKEVWAESVDVSGEVNAGSVSVGTQSTTNVNWQDVTPNRSFGIWYQAPDYDIDVTVDIKPNSTTNTQYVIFDVNDTQNGNFITQLRWVGGGSNGGDIRGFSATVPANHYYRTRLFTGASATIEQVYELK